MSLVSVDFVCRESSAQTRLQAHSLIFATLSEKLKILLFDIITKQQQQQPHMHELLSAKIYTCNSLSIYIILLPCEKPDSLYCFSSNILQIQASVS